MVDILYPIFIIHYISKQKKLGFQVSKFTTFTAYSLLMISLIRIAFGALGLFIFSATTSTSSAFLAIIASLISVFTSVIILLGEFFQKKNAPKPRHESTIRFF